MVLASITWSRSLPSPYSWTTSACVSCPQTAAEDLLEIIMRRYERASTLLTSNRRVDDWGKLLADVAAVSAMLDRLLSPRSRAQMRPSRSRDLTLFGQNDQESGCDVGA